MRTIVDTCIWSQVLRHKSPNLILKRQLVDLIQHNQVAIIGPIRQELLSGLADKKQFQQLQAHLEAFDDIPLITPHFEQAAQFSNLCRSKGFQGSTIDFLICAVAHLEKLSIFTTDKDFKHYQKHLPIQLIA